MKNERLENAVKEAKRLYSGKPGVTGVGYAVGERVAIRVLDKETADMIPESILGVDVDLAITGIIRAL